MPQLAELELPQLDVFSPEFLRDPHSHYAEALETSWIAGFPPSHGSPGGYLLLDLQSMKDFLGNEKIAVAPHKYIVDEWDAADTVWGKFQLDHPISMSGDDHKRLKNLVMPAFTPKKADQYRPLMRDRFEELMDDIADQGKGDFAKVARQYPIAVIGMLLGVPLEDAKRLEPWLLALVEGLSQQKQKLTMLNEAVEGLLEYIRPVIADRRAGNTKDDLLQTMIDSTDAGDRLRDDELHHYVIGLLSGGYDTTMNQLIHTVQRMCEFPEEYKKLAENPEGRTKAFIEESLRYKNMFGATARVTTKELEYRGVTIPANTLLTIPLTFAGQDPAFNECPAAFDPDRDKKVHIAFGNGIHFCPGMFVAYALLEEALPIVVKRLRNPRIAGELEYVGPFGPWAVRSLPIEWDVA